MYNVDESLEQFLNREHDEQVAIVSRLRAENEALREILDIALKIVLSNI